MSDVLHPSQPIAVHCRGEFKKMDIYFGGLTGIQSGFLDGHAQFVSFKEMNNPVLGVYPDGSKNPDWTHNGIAGQDLPDQWGCGAFQARSAADHQVPASRFRGDLQRLQSPSERPAARTDKCGRGRPRSRIYCLPRLRGSDRDFESSIGIPHRVRTSASILSTTSRWCFT